MKTLTYYFEKQSFTEKKVVSRHNHACLLLFGINMLPFDIIKCVTLLHTPLFGWILFFASLFISLESFTPQNKPSVSHRICCNCNFHTHLTHRQRLMIILIVGGEKKLTFPVVIPLCDVVRCGVTSNFQTIKQNPRKKLTSRKIIWFATDSLAFATRFRTYHSVGSANVESTRAIQTCGFVFEAICYRSIEKRTLHCSQNANVWLEI